jgi:hypothetical protein
MNAKSRELKSAAVRIELIRAIRGKKGFEISDVRTSLNSKKE